MVYVRLRVGSGFRHAMRCAPPPVRPEDTVRMFVLRVFVLRGVVDLIECARTSAVKVQVAQLAVMLCDR